MADTGKQSPLGQNVLGGILQHRCLQINQNAEYFMGVSTSNSQYTFGQLIEGTVLRMLTWAINDGFTRGVISDSTYNNIISISGDSNECYALGNSKPPTYIAEDPSESWAGTTSGSSDCKAVEFGVTQGVAGALPGPANAGYSVTSDTDYGQEATWLPYDTTNSNKSITQWGWVRCHALQAHNEFNFHAKDGSEGQLTPPKYEDFCGSFNEAASFCQYTNQTINTANNAESFMEGTFSNMDDLITGDVTGVTLYTKGLAWDLQNLEKIFDFKKLDRFGFPSTLLKQLYENGGLTQDLNLTMGSAGLSAKEIRNLSTGKIIGTAIQERKIYTAFLGISGENLINCVGALTTNNSFLYRCDPEFVESSQFGIRTLADLLDVKRLFSNCWNTLTVPVYNDVLGRPTGSKTYYLIYNEEGSVNSAINTTNVKEIVGTLICAGTPQPTEGTSRDNPSTELPMGFDSYLGGPNAVVPAQIGLAAGALKYAFLQISNIEQITPGDLGNCLRHLQVMDTSSPGADGTPASSDNGSGTEVSLQKPINETLLAEVQTQMGLGSSYAGTYRMDDFFGCMSGNPYNWKGVYSYLAGDSEIGNVTANTTTSELAAIYQQLFLAISWETATASVQTSLRAEETGGGGSGLYDYFYTITGLTITDAGGGYGRGGAPDPNVTISGTSGATATTDIGRNDQFTGSNSTGTFGRVTSLTLTSPGIEVQYAVDEPSDVPTDPGLTVAIETPPIGTYAWLPATGGTNSPNGTAYNYNTVPQYYIDAANAEITSLSNSDSSNVAQANMTWNVMGKQMKVEQRSRYNALGRVEVPRDPFVYTNQDLVSFVDSMPEYSDYNSRTSVGARKTLELIADRACDVGQNIVAQLRQENNEKALNHCGIPMTNNIPDVMPEDIRQQLLANGTVPGATEGIEIDGKQWTNPDWPLLTGVDGPIETSPGGKYISPIFVPLEGQEPGDWSPLINGDPNPQLGILISIGPPDSIRNTNSPLLNRLGSGGADSGGGSSNAGGGIPGGPNPPFILKQTPEEAIDRVIHCNCDCWDLIG